MTYQLRDEQVLPGHRLFQPMLDLQTLTSALNVSFEIFAKGPQATTGWQPGDWMQTVSTQFPDRALKLSSYMPMHALAQGVAITALQVTIAETRKSSPTDVVMPSAVHRPFDAAIVRIATLTYTNFYERWRPDMEIQFGPDINNWPSVFAFARRLRDFLVHTGGKVAFKSHNAKTVAWHNLTYSPAQNGHDVMGDVSVADLMVLVFELDDQMTALGFPTA